MKSIQDLTAIRGRLKSQGVKYCVGVYVDIHGVPEGNFVPIDHFERFAQGSELCTGFALAAGLEGIREGLDPGEPIEDNLYELTPQEFAQRGIVELPTTLKEVVEAFAVDPFLTEVLGQGLRDEFIACKSEEWRQYHQRISQ